MRLPRILNMQCGLCDEQELVENRNDEVEKGPRRLSRCRGQHEKQAQPQRVSPRVAPEALLAPLRVGEKENRVP
jgi:hypothetical protein